MTADVETDVDVAVVGAGQAGLAVGYHLHRHDRDADRHGRRRLDVVLLDASRAPGGSWPRMWDSLRLFSPAGHSSLPGRRMPPTDGPDTPSAAHVATYLADYEERYRLPVRHGVRVVGVEREGDLLALRGAGGERIRTRHLVNATGTWGRPFVPAVEGARTFAGEQRHVVDHDRPGSYAGRSVLVVGGGNSGAQVAAELLLAAERGEPSAREVRWVTTRDPRYLPDDVDGRVLFETATRAVRDLAAGREAHGVGSLGDIVATPDVRAARDRLGLTARVGLAALTPHGARFADGSTAEVDTVIWATGFRPDLHHLRGLRPATRDGHPATQGWQDGAYPTRSVSDPDLWFVGYGDWCGPASATLVGVGRAARDTVAGLVASLT